MRFRVVLPALIGAFFIVNCSKNTPADSGPGNPFQGVWAVVLHTPVTGGGDMTVSRDGSFTDTWAMQAGGQSFSPSVQGTVNDTGGVAASVWYNNLVIGTLTGTVWLANKAGSGNYNLVQPSSLQGMWSAVKK